MSDTVLLPDTLKELLLPISASSGTGEDLDPYVDPYESLSYRFSGEQTDYKGCIQDAESVLKEQSKHLQVISWLTLSWLVVEGLSGYRKGILLMKEVLVKYGAEVFPEKKKHRVNALRYLTRDKWVQVLGKKLEEEKASQKAEVVADIRKLLVDLADLFVEKLGESNKPDISGLLDIIDAVEVSSSEGSASKEPHTESVEEVVEDSNTLQIDSENTAEEAEEVNNSIHKEHTDIPLPEDVEELLEDISTSSRTGKDIELEPDEEDNLIYETLKSEMRNFSGNDYIKCIQLCSDILKNRSKHLRVVVLLCISWFRTEGVYGLKKGFILLEKILEKYSEDVFPVDVKKRVKIIQRLNSEPRLQMLGQTLIGNEQPKFKITDTGIKSLKDIPKPIERDLHKLKGQSFIGEEEFWRQVIEVIGNKAKDEQKKALLHHFTIEKAGQDQVSYAIDDQIIDAMRKAGLPSELGRSLDNLVGVEYRGWARSFDALLTELGEQPAKEYESVFKGFLNQNVTELLRLERVFNQFKERCSDKLQPDPPGLETLSETISSLADSARDVIEQASSDLESLKRKIDQSNKQEKKPEEKATQKSPQRSSREETRRSAEIKDPVSEGEKVVSISSLEIKWAEDADKLLKKALIFYVDDEHAGDEEELKAPLDAKFYGMSRSFRWSNITNEPPDMAIKGPEEITQNYYKNPPGNISANQLVRKYELAFLKQNEFLYWIDGQKVVVEALEKLGEQASLAVAEVKLHLARLLDRCPNLLSLTFQGKKTPFASPETKEWLKQEIIGKLGGGGDEKILPPVLGEEYDSINTAYEEACAALPEKFEEYAILMRQAIEKETRQRGKFLIRLNLANYYSLGQHPEIARANFNSLIRDLNTYTVSGWEPALCVAMWRSAYVNNSKLLQNELSSLVRTEIEKQQRELFELIARYDGVLAHKLIEYVQE